MCRFRHQQEMDPLQPCPPPVARPAIGTAHRFVFFPLTEDKSFTPTGIEKPSRIQTALTQNNRAHACDHCALSMYETHDQLIAKYASDMVDIARINKICKLASKRKTFRLGTHSASGDIGLAGVRSRASASGHFNLWAYEQVTFVDIFHITGLLS